MAHVKIYYTKDNRKIAEDVNLVREIMIHGNVNMQMIEKYYTVVYEFVHIKMIVDTNKFLEELFRKFNSSDNPLNNPDSQEKIKNSGTFTSMTIGSVIQIGDEYYSVAAFGFKKFS